MRVAAPASDVLPLSAVFVRVLALVTAFVLALAARSIAPTPPASLWLAETERVMARPRARRNVVTAAATGSLAVVDAFDGGFGWQPHPDESLERCSHALRTDDGLWLLDPFDAPGLDDELAARSAGPDDEAAVAGVAICAGWHARDAAAIAARHDVPVTVPSWMDRPLDHLDAPASATESTAAVAANATEVAVQRVDDRLPGTDVVLHRVSPMGGSWTEAVCWRERDRTLYVPESLGTAAAFRVGDERLGVIFYARLFPPRDALAGFSPERVLVGHGTGIFEDAERALADALAGSRTRFPRALLENAPRATLNLVRSIRR